MVNWQSPAEVAKDGRECPQLEGFVSQWGACSLFLPESFDRLMHTLLGLYM
jgi:hypothetical protein